jgi:hypothetical protein
MAADGSITPAIHEHPAVDRQRLRQKCERAVDKLLMILDAIEEDPDLEPSLGLLESTYGNHYAPGYGDQTRITEGGTDDRELDRSDEDHNLGWESHGAQVRLDAGTDDLEPALGWPERLDQSRDRRTRTEHEDEPTMGAAERPRLNSQEFWADNHDYNNSEREEVSEDEGAPTGDDEPLLGFHETPTGTSQFASVVVSSDEHEPSLGSTHNLDQRRWANHFGPDATHASFDYEDEHDGREEEEDAQHDGCEPEDAW